MNQRGAGRAGCLLVVLVSIVFVFLCVKIVPVYLDKYEFEDDLARLASKAGASGWAGEFLKLQVIEAAHAKEFIVNSEEDIEVSSATPYGGIPEVKVKIAYEKSVDLAGYWYTFKFQSDVSSFVGTL